MTPTNNNKLAQGADKVTDLNGFRAVKALLRFAADYRIAEIEGSGLDSGRVFIHLRSGFRFAHPYLTVTLSAGSVAELKYARSLIEKMPREKKKLATVV